MRLFIKKYLFLFILLFLFVPIVNAEIQSFSFSNIKFYDNNQQKNSTSYFSNTTNTGYDGLNMTSSKFTITFDNNFSNFNEIGFELYNSLSQINSNPNYNVPIMPLVVLDGYPCSVTPIGIMDANQPYYYNGDEFVLCPVKQKTGSHYIDIFTYKLPTSTNPFIGVHVNYVKGYTDDETLKDVITQQEQTQQAITDGTNKIDDTINSDDVSSSDDTLNDLNSKLATNNVISDLLLLPVTLYQKIISSLNGTCSPFNLGTLYNHNLTLPCINLENYLGSSIMTTIDLIISGLFVLVIRKKFVDIFNNMTNLKNGGNEIE